MNRRLRLALVAVLLVALGSTVRPASREPVQGRQAMVVSVSRHASEAGVEILKKGGNAVDAAVAVGFALAVTWPAAGNLGADGFMVIHGATGKNVAIDYRAMAPRRASRDMFLDEKGGVKLDLLRMGHLSAGVPGAVAGLLLALESHGTLDRATVLAPAIRLAAEGFEVDQYLATSIREAETRLSPFPESRRIFLRDGKFYEPGDRLVQPELAVSLRLIAEQGAKGFYEGRVARLIADEMRKGGGIIDEEDLRGYRALERQPVTGTYRGHTIVSMPPPSSGGAALVEMLNMVEPYDLASLGHNSSAHLHLVAEVMKRAYADRAEFMADSDFAPVPVRGLVSKRYAEIRRKGIDPMRATPSAEIRAGDPLPFESEATTHFSVVAPDGSAVSNTYTLKSLFGSGVTIPGTGFIMNDEMDNFTVKVGEPNTFGLIQAAANAIEPGKRPLSSMTPSIVLKDGRVRLVAGTPGGSTIINTVFQLVMNVVDFGLDAQEAVDASRIHHQWLPDILAYERNGMVRDVQGALKSRGHALEERRAIGDAHIIVVDDKSGLRLGGADPRRGGHAVGY